jgi:hypothetical protein
MVALLLHWLTAGSHRECTPGPAAGRQPPVARDTCPPAGARRRTPDGAPGQRSGPGLNPAPLQPRAPPASHCLLLTKQSAGPGCLLRRWPPGGAAKKQNWTKLRPACSQTEITPRPHQRWRDGGGATDPRDGRHATDENPYAVGRHRVRNTFSFWGFGRPALTRVGAGLQVRDRVTMRCGPGTCRHDCYRRVAARKEPLRN